MPTPYDYPQYRDVTFIREFIRASGRVSGFSQIRIMSVDRPFDLTPEAPGGGYVWVIRVDTHDDGSEVETARAIVRACDLAAAFDVNHRPPTVFFDSWGSVCAVCSPDDPRATAGGPRGAARLLEVEEIEKLGLLEEGKRAWTVADDAGRIEHRDGWAWLK